MYVDDYCQLFKNMTNDLGKFEDISYPIRAIDDDLAPTIRILNKLGFKLFEIHSSHIIRWVDGNTPEIDPDTILFFSIPLDLALNNGFTLPEDFIYIEEIPDKENIQFGIRNDVDLYKDWGGEYVIARMIQEKLNLYIWALDILKNIKPEQMMNLHKFNSNQED